MPVKPLCGLARALCCALALLMPLQGLQAQVQSQVRLPALGESAAEDFNVSTERRLGDQIMGEIRRDPDYLDDPVLLEYLQALWQPLVDAARTRGDVDVDTGTQFAWEAFLVRDKSVNAFALPGGFVGVHLGLIAMTASRDELASVLAHELSHITQRHIARSVANQSRQSLLGVAGMILAVLAASRSNNPDMAQAAIVGSQAAMVQGQLNFSRDMEREADRVGFAVLGQAGYDPAGMSAMFEKLDIANRLNDNGAYPYLRSHPLSLERQSEARLRAQGVQGTSAATPSPQTLHPLMAARARVLMDTSVVALRRLQEPPLPRPGQTPTDRLAALYASALASSLLRDHAQAERRIAEARALLGGQADPEQLRAFALLDAEGRLAAGDVDGAQAQMARVQGRWPAPGQARPVLLLHAHAALQRRGGDRDVGLRSSLEALQTWVTAHPRDAMAWMLLGTTADALGLRLRALRAQAESRWLLGDLTGAMDRLRTGRTLARSGAAGQDFIEVSIIDARLRELESLRRQQLAEQRGGRGERGERSDDKDRGSDSAKDGEARPPLL
jgi:predicted Zn-dependent protease